MVSSLNSTLGGTLAGASKPGSTTAAGTSGCTGYSWIVRILPYLEETNLYKNISAESTGFTVSPFSTAIVNGNATYQHASCVTLPSLVCPSWGGDAGTNSNTTVDNTISTEYAAIDTATPGTGTQKFTGKVAQTNYKAMVGTHICQAAQSSGAPTSFPLENGAMAISAASGSTISSITDGTSKTFLVSETKELGYCSWYDGTLNWVVGNNPNLGQPGTGTDPNTVAPWSGTGVTTAPGVAINVRTDTRQLGHCLSVEDEVLHTAGEQHPMGSVERPFQRRGDACLCRRPRAGNHRVVRSRHLLELDHQGRLGIDQQYVDQLAGPSVFDRCLA